MIKFNLTEEGNSIGSKHIKNFEERFIERGLTPLEEIKDAKHKVPCVDAEGYKYLLCYHSAVGDKRTKNFNRWDKKNPFKPYNMRLYASRVQYNAEILSTDDELMEASNVRIKFKRPQCGKTYDKWWGHWKSMPYNRHVCPECNDNQISAGYSSCSILTEDWLREHDIPYIREYSFDDCKNKRCLRFDFCVNWNGRKILIEVDGHQHFYVGGWTDESKLHYNQKLDKIKEDYCTANGHILVRIPYWLYRHTTYKDILNQTFFS